VVASPTVFRVPLGVAVTWYLRMGLPPSDAGVDQITVTTPSPAVT
jgi:hypothetical protein